MTDFSRLMNGVQRDDDAWTADVGEDWRQGRTLFGGLSGALCLEAAKREFTDLPPLRSAQFALIGPSAGKIMVRVSMLRRGKSTAFVGADLFGEDGLGASDLLSLVDEVFLLIRSPRVIPREKH